MKTAMKNTAQYRRARTTTRPRCQRFTFKAVRDTEGEILYYLILPYLKLSGDVEGSYKENYHLTLKTSGEIGICNTCTEGNPADECRWTLSGAITGMTVTNCGESVNLGVDLDEEIVAGVTAYGTDVWHVIPICLNVETDYQRKTNTCGAACGTMIVNYLKNGVDLITESKFVEDIGGDQNSKHIGLVKDEVNDNIPQANYIVGWYSNLTSTALMEMLSRSLNHETMNLPIIMNVKPESSEEKSNWGYSYSTDPDASTHFVVVNGLYYDPITNSYFAIVCDPHYKYDVVGGRTFVFDWNDLTTAFYQGRESLMHK